MLDKKLNKCITFFIALSLMFISCSPSQEDTTSEVLPDKSMPKFDIHTHYRYERDFLQPLLEEWNMKTMLVQVDLGDPAVSRQKWEDIKTHHAQYPDRFVICAGFQAAGIDEPDYADKMITQIKQDLADGAIAVKVWKNFGMVSKDADSNYVQIDDERLQPIWDFLTKEKVPVLAHIGEPLQAFRPLVESERNPHFNYFNEHPQYHAYQHPEIPRWETIMQARDNWLARNPELVVIGAHTGSMSHDVAEIAKRLEQYPNFYVEPAARFGDLVRQESEKVRAFFIRYQDRIFYGTDLGTNQPAEGQSAEAQQNQREYINKMIDIHWQYLSGADSLYYDSPMISFPISSHSLNLPDSVLRKIYWENASKLLGI